MSHDYNKFFYRGEMCNISLLTFRFNFIFFNMLLYILIIRMCIKFEQRGKFFKIRSCRYIIIIHSYYHQIKINHIIQFLLLTRYPSSIIILLTDQVVYLLTICHPNNQLNTKYVLVRILKRKIDNEIIITMYFFYLLLFFYFFQYLLKNTFVFSK